MRGATNAGAGGGGLKIIASGEVTVETGASETVNFGETAKIIFVTATTNGASWAKYTSAETLMLSSPGCDGGYVITSSRNGGLSVSTTDFTSVVIQNDNIPTNQIVAYVAMA